MGPSAACEEVSLKLRIAWGGGTERVWQGAVSIQGGTFSQLELLGIEADEPGSIWLEGSDHVHIKQPSLRAYDGIDVVVTADLDAPLTIWLSSGETEAATNVELTLRDIVERPHHTLLDDTENRLSVARSPGDRMRIDFDREHLVFAPGESFSFQVLPHLIDTSTKGLWLHARIVTHPGEQRVWSEEYRTGDDGTATSITLRVPETEGVYDLLIAAMPPSRIKQRFGLQKPLVERKVQFVVLDRRAASSAGEAPTSRVVEINPMNARWWERYANLQLFPGFRKGPLGNGDAVAWEHPALGPMMQLGTGGAAPNVSWEAYPLPINHPGQVHVLEIEYPSNVPQAMGISLMEPNAAGAVMPIGLDSGVYVTDEEAENPPQMLKHRVLFWPRSKTPLLLITNRRPGSRAVYGRISVLGAPAAQFQVPGLAIGRSGGGSLPPAFANETPGGRLLAAAMDRPLVAENFGAPEALDPQSQRSLDDWYTFHQGGTRLVKYLKHVGYNGLMLAVLADGSTIYPSRLLEPTPRYDTGVFFATGQDPVRKDALELLFRLFDRESLVLIPSLQFAAPLPDLEDLKRGGGSQAVGIEWIGADGNPWQATGAARQGLAPYYNLLDPRVQRAMLDVVGEVVARYADHESFGGVALQLTPEGYAQLPGEHWGFDDRTIARFERETNSRVPGSGPRRFAERAEYLRGAGREAWLTWRAKVVADFHRRIERQITAQRPTAKLYLAGGAMLENRQTQARLRPALLRRAKLDDAFKEIGLDVRAYAGESGVVLLRPQCIRPQTGPPPAGAIESEIYLAREMDNLFAGATRASQFYHEPQKLRLASFDVQSPFGAANTYTWLVSQLSPSGERNRRRFVHSLAVSDAAQMFDGGWLLPLGQEATLRDLVSVYRQLPSQPFQTIGGESQPVTIRTLVHEGQTYVYLVNDSPWPVGVTMQVDAPAKCRLEAIGANAGVGPLVRSGGLTTWKVSLRPYDLAAARLLSADVRIRNPAVVVPPQVRLTLKQRIDDLVARVRALSNPEPLAVIENADFELPADGEQVPAWTAIAPPGGRVALDSRYKRQGRQSLVLSSTGPNVSVTSSPFSPPSTGRLAVEVWLRAPQDRQPPALRIALEGATREGRFEPHGVIDRVGQTAGAPGDWGWYRFPIDNLSADGLGELRVRFELLGAGEVWIDDIRVFDLWFEESELIELSKISALASVHLEKEQVADCARLLEGYWPQFLAANVALTTANLPVAQRPKESRPAPEPPKKPGVFENMRNYLPLFR